MVQINVKKDYRKMVDYAERGELKAAVRTAVDADMNMFTLLEMSQLMEMDDGPTLPLKELAVIGMYIEIERNKRKLLSMGYAQDSYQRITA